MARRNGNGRGTSRGIGRGTPLFSFETPSRERTGHDTNRGARELLRDITGSNHGSPSATSVTPTSRPSGQSGSPLSTGGTASVPALPVNNTASENQTPPLLTNNSTPSTGIDTSDVSREIRHLREQQKKLAASSARIEEMLKTLAASKEDSSPLRSAVPRELSALVRDVYNKLTDEESVEWNYLASFDDESNREITSLLVQNVLAVSKDGQHDFSTIKRAARTYFKTKKSAHQRKRTGKENTTAIAARRRQRKHNKAHARLRALNLSTTLSGDDKEKIRPVLKADFMSSDESDANNITRSQPDAGASSESDGEGERPDPEQRKKKLIRHRLPWRSRELQLTLESLDRKIARRRSDRAKAMCLEITPGNDSSRPIPDNSPEWAIELFS